MRFLFVAGGGAATIHASAPLAWAARAAGHEVIVGCPAENTALVAGLGLPAAAVGELGIFDAMTKDRRGQPLPRPDTVDGELDFVGRGFARLSAGSLPGLVRLGESWRPDVIVGGEYNHAAALLSHRLSVPHVRHVWGPYDRSEVDWRGAVDELGPELAAAGLADLPPAALFLDITPPSIRPADAEPAAPMRWAPGNQQFPLEPWMYARGKRPRVVLTSGSRSSVVAGLGADFFRPLLATPALADSEVEVVVATAEPVATEVRAIRPGVRAGWVPLDVLAPTADLVLHHGGGVTAMTLIAAGTPQLCVPEMLASAASMQRVDAQGASLTLAPHTTDPGEIGAAIGRVLADDRYRKAAAALAAEVAAMPPAGRVVEDIAALVHA
ncbi:dNTP-hexose glycosyl transferase [Pilimelia anulata]|uniref:DNTP-hexose glycosyl transferase n=1 Tax=Pilimelia anulata TaxID=53371 RepID=A0A8J3BCB1_9ACTN|nr:nucleotide disphospho-sugar-binding domain-containing protein [Pilimelia anulata]GGJ96480.1 dNTP-hexose glycosyl transferase [Pilimelia anulata]